MVVTHLLLNYPLNHLDKYLVTSLADAKAIVIIRMQWDSNNWWIIGLEFIGFVFLWPSNTKVTISGLAILEDFFKCLRDYCEPPSHTQQSTDFGKLHSIAANRYISAYLQNTPFTSLPCHSDTEEQLLIFDAVFHFIWNKEVLGPVRYSSRGGPNLCFHLSSEWIYSPLKAVCFQDESINYNIWLLK